MLTYPFSFPNLTIPAWLFCAVEIPWAVGVILVMSGYILVIS